MGELQRRGAHVKTPEIGSRDEVYCFWGNIGIYAELRRELKGGLGNVLVLGGFGRGLRGWLRRRGGT
jgi:hypothetical protein